jgi:uncharacterized protein involved in outer membrane biogenesis
MVVLVVLAVAIAVAGTLILHSDWLGERVLAGVSERLGMDVHAESFSLGWGGDATLGQVSVRMPLSDEVVFSADKMELGLDAVPLLILGRSIHASSVKLDSPTVFLRQSENGRWNVQDVWTRVRMSVDTSPQQGRGIRLPKIVIHDATVRITESGGTTQLIGPIGFDGYRQGNILWVFDLRAPPIAHIGGQVVEGSDWAHEVRFTVKDIQPLARSMLGPALSPIHLTGQWKGKVLQKTLRGAVQLDELVVGRVALQGDAQVEATSDRIMIGPRSLIANEPNLAGEPIQLTSGAVEISRERITLASLAAKAGALGGRIDGHWDPDTGSGEFSGSWAAALPNESSQSYGTYQFSVKSPQEGGKEAQANVIVQAQTPLGSWHVVASALGTGADWQLSRWQIKVPTLSWSRGERQVAVTDAIARLDLRWPQIQLTSLSMPEAKQVNGNARFDVHTRRWSTQLAIEQLQGPSLGANGLDFRLSAEGDNEKARVSELRLAMNESVVTAKGDVSLVGRGLENVHLSADWPARTLRPGPPAAQQPIGRWHLDAAVTGQAQPVALDAQATLSGQKITLGKRLVDQVEVPVHVNADGRQIDATTQPFDLLGGQWQLTGRYDLSKRATQIHVMAADLSLGRVASMVGLPLTSQGQARAEVRLRMPGFEIQKAVAAGSWSAQDVNIPPLAARRAEGALRIVGGTVRLENIQLEQDDGRARASMEFQLDEPQIVSIELDAKSWPLQLEGRPLTLVVDGRAKLQADVVKKTAEGEARLTSRIVWRDKDLANIRLATLLQGQIVNVWELHAETLGGFADGTAVIPLSHWIDSVAQLRWQGIQPELLAAWLPSFERFQGTMSGSLAVEQTRKGAGQKMDDGGPKAQGTKQETVGGPFAVLPSEAHPLGPMRFLLDADMTNGRFGPARIDVCRITGYLDPTRLLIEKACFDALGGRLNTRARFSTHAGRYYGSVAADFSDLNLNQLVHAIDPNATEHVGRLSGSATVLPAFDRQISLAGQGRINLTQSDLVNNSIVRTLYDTLSLRFGPQEPTGTGEVRFSFEGPAVVLSSAQYFNRGVEIRGAGEIKNVNLGTDSPVEGYAVASTRVLRGINLPGIRALDRLLDIIQTGASSVKIAGVLDNVDVKVVPLPEVLGPFRRLLWAQLNG